MKAESGPGTARAWLDRVFDPLRRRLAALLHPGARDRQDLIRYVHDAESRHLIDVDTAAMMEGAVLVSETKVLDIMVPRSEMVFIEVDATPAEFLPGVIESAHSRFPVLDAKHEKVLGILLAKDLLPLAADADQSFNIRDILRPAVFVPESKALTELLRDFRSNRNHMAIVIDEFGQTAGLVTIEDVLEEIVGEIEDEFDVADGESAVYTLADGSYRVAGDGPIAEVNRIFGLDFPEDEFDTIGGLVAHELGRVPRRGESVDVGGLHFVVMLARGGAVRWFRVTRATPADPADDPPKAPVGPVAKS